MLLSTESMSDDDFNRAYNHTYLADATQRKVYYVGGVADKQMHLFPIDEETGEVRDGSSHRVITTSINIRPTCVTGYINYARQRVFAYVTRPPLHQFKRGLSLDHIRVAADGLGRVNMRGTNLYALYFPTYGNIHNTGSFALSRDFAVSNDRLFWRDRVVGVFKDGTALLSSNYSWLKPFYGALNYEHVQGIAQETPRVPDMERGGFAAPQWITGGTTASFRVAAESFQRAHELQELRWREHEEQLRAFIEREDARRRDRDRDRGVPD